MPMIPTNWQKLSAKEIEGYKNNVCKQGVIYLQGNVKGEPHKCSYCPSKEVLYKGSVWISGGVGSFFYLACEKCYKKFAKMEQPRGAPPALSSRWGNYMHGSGGMKGGLSSNGRGLSG